MMGKNEGILMMEAWFRDAKFGIFVHWGIFAVAGVEASWSFFQHGTDKAVDPQGQWLGHEEYMRLAGGFTASRFDAREWARLFKAVGARYAVLTAKHHDGVALWPTAAGPLHLGMTGVRTGQDLVGEFCEAMREVGIHVGLYFSHLDWSHPDYASVWKGGRRENSRGAGEACGAGRFSYPKVVEEPARWERFLQFHRMQIRELCERYQPELIWFDGEWERTSEQWRMRELRGQLQTWRPGIVVNGRMGGLGDYLTPEQGMPVRAPRVDGGWSGELIPWEFCTTLNHQWGYSGDNSRLKPAHHLSRMLMEVAGMGGNLLLNIGPREDGTFDEIQRARLKDLGAWVRRNAEALFGKGESATDAGLPAGHVYGASTIARDRRTVYVCVFDQPVSGGDGEGEIAVKGIRNKVRRVRRVDSGLELGFTVEGGADWANVPGVLWVKMGGEFDPLGTVVAIELEGELDLYTG